MLDIKKNIKKNNKKTFLSTMSVDAYALHATVQQLIV